ncbi:MAG: hypothetical protein EP329_03140 [Deltaproteobacteria bacterium]|nr:MAG: hypothetical protein EP329_03140 [Deltaproteobacteria bacterium]
MSIPATRLAAPALSGPAEDGWREETLTYRVSPLPKPRFKTVLDPRAVFGEAVRSTVTTRVHEDGRVHLALTHRLSHGELRETLEATDAGGLAVDRLTRVIERSDGERVRTEDVRFTTEPIGFPEATYPETILPFLLRSDPAPAKKRAVYAWTNDRFTSRVYYERRKTVSVTGPTGTHQAELIWMYPDLNDWIALGAVLTKLAKPFIPHYSLWYEAAAPHRLLRFEGPYGPPGAPELLLELAE